MSEGQAAAYREEPQLSHINWLLILGVQLAAILEILDMTIVNVALPHMLGAFGATPDQITWVLTAYLVSQAIVMPLTGYLSKRLGRRRLLYMAISGFVAASAICGVSESLQMIVAFRFLQGMFGATLIPLSQSILLMSFPRHQRGVGMAIFGLGLMVAPIFGPVLGGWLTEYYSWRMVFFINIPVGLLALTMIIGQLEADAPQEVRTDWAGLALLALAIGTLQLVIDQGETRDWLNSRLIQVLIAICFFSGLIFMVRGWNKADNIIDLRLFRDRNFAAACIAIFVFGIGMFGSIVLIPLLTQRLLGYPPETAGILFAPRGVAAAITMILAGTILLRKFDARFLVGTGITLTGFSSLVMSNYSLDVDFYWLVLPGVFMGIGTALFFVPLTTVAFDSIAAEKQDEASGLYGVMRSIGSSIGISVISALLVRQTQVHWNILGGHIDLYSVGLKGWLVQRGMSLSAPETLPTIANEIARQAQMLAFIDLFWFIGWSTIGLVPIALLMRKPTRKEGVIAH